MPYILNKSLSHKRTSSYPIVPAVKSCKEEDENSIHGAELKQNNIHGEKLKTVYMAQSWKKRQENKAKDKFYAFYLKKKNGTPTAR